MPDQAVDAVDNLARVQKQIAAAAQAAGRDLERDPVTVIAVSKKFGGEMIRPVLAAGHRVFGENRVQEAMEKWPSLCAEWPGIELRLIGPLQSNKAKDAVALFDVIETVDRPKIARALASEIEAQGRQPKLLIQVNTGEEPQKAGIAPEDVDEFVALCRDTLGLSIDGLMCIPPVDDNPGLHFALLGKIAARNAIRELSMGMSGDFDVAVRLGATHIRVGSAIFGARPA